jgi:hypothetical protein
MLLVSQNYSLFFSLPTLLTLLSLPHPNLSFRRSPPPFLLPLIKTKNAYCLNVRTIGVCENGYEILVSYGLIFLCISVEHRLGMGRSKLSVFLPWPNGQVFGLGFFCSPLRFYFTNRLENFGPFNFQLFDH